MLAALKLHEMTGEKNYLDTVKRLYDWTREHLQDRDGLVSDSISQVSLSSLSHTLDALGVAYGRLGQRDKEVAAYRPLIRVSTV